MKIIDSHIHIGRHGDWDFPGELLVKAMDQYRIGFGLVSNVAGGEFLGNEAYRAGGDQIAVNEAVKAFAADHPGRFKGLFWIRPHLEGYAQKVEDYLLENRDVFYGLKVHPSQSRLAFTAENHRDYLEMGARLNLPVAVHTENDGFADPSIVYETAKAFPNVNFVLVHMGLRTDHGDSIRFIRELPNLYGDTTFVDPESALRAVKECGSRKILFGTDAPTFGIDIYERYQSMLKRFETEFSPADQENVLFRNAERLFRFNN